MSEVTTSYDFIVVGAGTAGSAPAARLSEDAGTRVLLVEAGGATPPAAFPHLLEWQTLSAWPRRPRPPNGHAREGHGNHHLSGSWFPPPLVDDQRDELSARTSGQATPTGTGFGAKGWTFDDLLPYFKRSETAAHGDFAVRGTGGPWRVAPASPINEAVPAVLCAAVQTGYQRAKDARTGFENGFGPSDLTIVDGIRHSAAVRIRGRC